jgi:hypothetical protein
MEAAKNLLRRSKRARHPETRPGIRYQHYDIQLEKVLAFHLLQAPLSSGSSSNVSLMLSTSSAENRDSSNKDNDFPDLNEVDTLILSNVFVIIAPICIPARGRGKERNGLIWGRRGRGRRRRGRRRRNGR